MASQAAQACTRSPHQADSDSQTGEPGRPCETAPIGCKLFDIVYCGTEHDLLPRNSQRALGTQREKELTGQSLLNVLRKTQSRPAFLSLNGTYFIVLFEEMKLRRIRAPALLLYTYIAPRRRMEQIHIGILYFIIHRIGAVLTLYLFNVAANQSSDWMI